MVPGINTVAHYIHDIHTQYFIRELFNLAQARPGQVEQVHVHQ